jgi:hypothetical protein
MPAQPAQQRPGRCHLALQQPGPQGAAGRAVCQRCPAARHAPAPASACGVHQAAVWWLAGRKQQTAVAPQARRVVAWASAGRSSAAACKALPRGPPSGGPPPHPPPPSPPPQKTAHLSSPSSSPGSAPKSSSCMRLMTSRSAMPPRPADTSAAAAASPDHGNTAQQRACVRAARPPRDP